MDWLSFISSIIAACSWPVTVLIVVILLRRPLRDLVPLVQKLKYKEVEIEFGKRVGEVRAEVVRELPQTAGPEELSALAEGPFAVLAELSPRSAVLEAWREVELAALEAARRLGGPSFGDRTLTYRAIGFLEKQEILDRNVISLLRDLRGLRNQAAHAPDFALSKESALEYAASAKAVADYLKAAADVESGKPNVPVQGR